MRANRTIFPALRGVPHPDTLAKYEEWTHSMAQIMMLTLMSVRVGSLTTGLVAVGRGCTPMYFFEGFPIEPLDVWGISPDMLEAVEVYSAPTIPPEFWWLGRMPCGAVAYWMRREPHQGVDAQAWKKVLVGAGVLGIGLFLILLK